jgi:formate hydrogenlyase subunit 3/multisubunit Na+/H+ antiporter MnhD subunit
VVCGLVAIPFVNIFWSKFFLGLLQNSLGIANDTIMAITRSAGLFNSIACLAALAGMAWLQVKSQQSEPARSFRTLGSVP